MTTVVRALAVFEYGESPAALCARTRYVYVVRDARPLSLYVVAVPATAAIWTKFAQLEPVQRSMRTSVCFGVLFTQFNRIELRDNAVAVKLAGAFGRPAAFTTMDALVEFEHPANRPRDASHHRAVR